MNKKLIHHTIIAARTALLGLACVSIAVAENQADELKQRILAQAQSMGPDDYAFTRTIRSDATSNGKAEKKVRVEKFDPTKPAEARWTLVSVDGAVRLGSFSVKLLSYPVCLIQSGRVQSYALFVVIGFLAFLGYYVTR